MIIFSHFYHSIHTIVRHWYSLLCADVPLRNYSLTVYQSEALENPVYPDSTPWSQAIPRTPHFETWIRRLLVYLVHWCPVNSWRAVLGCAGSSWSCLACWVACAVRRETDRQTNWGLHFSISHWSQSTLLRSGTCYRAYPLTRTTHALWHVDSGKNSDPLASRKERYQIPTG